MPKTKAQKRYQGSTPTTAQGAKRTLKTQEAVSLVDMSQTQRNERPRGAAQATARSVLASKKRAGATQALVMAGMVAVGCWGLAFTFIFLTTTQNHVLIGGMIAVMAVMWTFSFVLRLRKAQR